MNGETQCSMVTGFRAADGRQVYLKIIERGYLYLNGMAPAAPGFSITRIQNTMNLEPNGLDFRARSVYTRPMRSLALVAIIAVGASAQAPSPPGWVSGTSPEYPKGAFLTGVGEGPTQEKAADKARAEIAKIFSLEVRAETQVSAREVTDGVKSSYSQDVSDDVRTFTAKVIEGVEIARYGRGEAGTHYALAVLDRGHSLKVFKDKIEAGDKEFAELSERLGKTDGKFTRIRLALRLVGLGKSRRRFNADYRLLNPDGTGLEAPAAFAEALASARKAVAAVTVQVDVQGTNAARVTTRFIDALSAYGLRATEKGGRAPDVLVEAVGSGRNLRAENLTWFRAEGSLAVKMSYGASGEAITRFEEAGTDASGDPRSAVGQTLAKLSEKAAGRVFKVLVSGDLLDD